ncbi:MAG: DUF2905 domain-containing protein [Chlamydiales bacterium]|nr:DUF2905 domain-containing protein [Chlamydiales bacterium]
MDGTLIGKWLVIIGSVVIVAGLALWVIAKAGLPLGGLPGDFQLGKGNFNVRIPLATSLLISIVLTILLNLLLWLFRR